MNVSPNETLPLRHRLYLVDLEKGADAIIKDLTKLVNNAVSIPVQGRSEFERDLKALTLLRLWRLKGENLKQVYPSYRALNIPSKTKCYKYLTHAKIRLGLKLVKGIEPMFQWIQSMTFLKILEGLSATNPPSIPEMPVFFYCPQTSDRFCQFSSMTFRHTFFLALDWVTFATCLVMTVLLLVRAPVLIKKKIRSGVPLLVIAGWSFIICFVVASFIWFLFDAELRHRLGTRLFGLACGLAVVYLLIFTISLFKKKK